MCASTSLTALRFQNSQMKPRFLHLLLVRCTIQCHICGIAVKMSTKAEAILGVLCATLGIFGTHLAQNSDSLA
jgi:hypothetical protein